MLTARIATFLLSNTRLILITFMCLAQPGQTKDLSACTCPHVCRRCVALRRNALRVYRPRNLPCQVEIIIPRIVYIVKPCR